LPGAVFAVKRGIAWVLIRFRPMVLSKGGMLAASAFVFLAACALANAGDVKAGRDKAERMRRLSRPRRGCPKCLRPPTSLDSLRTISSPS
jgi:hypothetical protein